jgi:PAS domain-containing protein
MPGAWGCKDINSVFIYANQTYADIIGIKNKEDIIGKTDFDMSCETVNVAELFQAQDKKVMTNLA